MATPPKKYHCLFFWPRRLSSNSFFYLQLDASSLLSGDLIVAVILAKQVVEEEEELVEAAVALTRVIKRSSLGVGSSLYRGCLEATTWALVKLKPSSRPADPNQLLLLQTNKTQQKLAYHISYWLSTQSRIRHTKNDNNFGKKLKKEKLHDHHVILVLVFLEEKKT